MNSPTQPPHNPHPARDPLLERYEEANAHDSARPDPALRERVLARARSMAEQHTTQAAPPRTPAANDGAWKLRALGSLAALGLVGLLVLQFDRGTPDEHRVALGPATSPSAPPASEQATQTDQSDAPESANAPSGKPFTPPPLRGPDPDAAARLPAPESAPAQAPAADAEALAPSHAETARSRNAPQAAPAGVTGTAGDQSAEAMTPPRLERRPEAPRVSAMEQAPASPPETRAADPSLAAGRSQQLKERTVAPAQSPDPGTDLREATKLADTGAIARALAQGSEVDARDSAGRTALMLAAQGPSRATIEQLLKAGASRELRDAQGLNAADHARLAGRLEWLVLLQP